MADEDITLRIKLETEKKQLEADLDSLEKRFEELRHLRNKALNEHSGSGGTEYRLYDAELRKLGKTLDEKAATLKRINEELVKLDKEGGEHVNKLKEEFDDVDGVANNLSRTLATVFTIGAAKEFVSKMANIRGEFQQLEIAFETILGSKEKAEKMMADAVDLAAKTPFDLQGVADGAKSLLAYGLQSEKVVDTLRRLGDVAAGLSQPLGRLTAIYGQTMVKGVLQTRDLIRYQSAGIPILDELVKLYKAEGKAAGDTTNKVRELITAGKVSFADVEKVFANMTSEGGKFANLMEKQSASITGRISNIQDAIESMFNEIGKKNEGTIYKALDGVANLVENYEKVGKVLASVAKAYGATRAVLVVYIALQKMATRGTTKDTIEQIKNIATKKGAAAAQTALNKAILANPYVMAAAGLAALGVAMYKYASHTSQAAKTSEELSKSEGNILADIIKEKSELDRLNGQLETTVRGSKEWKMVKNEIVSKFGKYKSNLDEEITKVGNLSTAYNGLAKSIGDTARVRQYNTFISGQEELLNTEIQNNVNALRQNLYKVAELQKKIPQKNRHEKYRNLTDEEYRATIDKEMGQKLQETLDYIYNGTDNKNLETFWAFRGIDLGRMLTDAKADAKTLTELRDVAKKTFDITDEMLQGSRKENETPEDDPDKTEKEKKREHNLRMRALESTRKLNQQELQDRINLSEQKVALMEDGYDKERAQNQLNFDKEMLSIKKQREERLKALQEDEKTKWQAANPDAPEYKFTSQKYKELPKEIADTYDQLESDAIDKFAMANANAYSKMAKEYGTAKERMLAIERDWNVKIEQLRDSASATDNETLKKQFNTLIEQYGREKRLALAKENEAIVNGMAGSSREDRRAALKERLDAELEITIAAYDEELKLADEQGKELINKKKEIAKAFNNLKLAEFDYGEIAEYGDFTPVLEALKSKFMAQMETLPDDLKDGLKFSLQEAVDNFVLQFAQSGRDIDLQEFYSNLAGKSIAALKNQLNRAKQELEAIADSTEGEDLDALEAAQKRIYVLEAQINKLGNTEKKTNLNLADMGQIIQEAASQFTALGDAVGQNNEGLGTILKTLGTFVGIAAGVIAAIAAITAAEATALTVTMGWLAIAGAVVAAIGAVVAIVNANKEAAEKSTRAAQDYAAALQGLNDAAKLDNLTNAFGTDAYKQFKAFNQQLEDAKKNMSQFSKIDIVSDMRSGWQKFWGTGLRNIEKVNLSDFIDANGELDGDRLSAWYEVYGDNIDTETKNMIDQILNEWNRYQDAVEGISDYLSDLFSDTASNVADAMISAFEESGSALADLTDIANSFGKAMAKDVVTSTLMSSVFTDAAQENIKKLLVAGDVTGAVEAYNKLMEEANAKAPEITKFLKGLNVWDADDREGESKGIAQASQDSVDELNGRATVMQTHTFEINASAKAIAGITEDIKQQNSILVVNTASILNELMGIHRDTTGISGKIDGIAYAQTKINNSLTWMIDKGVKAI